ncbi:MAG: serine/threonine protein kinase [Prevotellaceae bacterium]|jgi:serine/threonine protein kinase|nr:serine/threonine protein kinase [Prevotellaceae bacterium]
MTFEEFKKRYEYNPATDKLGEGGFGSVFKTYDNHRNRLVALKISKVNPEYENIRLKKEVEIVAHLPSHPYIAYYEECYTFASFDGEYDFGILQYYEHGNLAQLLKKGNLLPEQKQNILIQILEGIEFLHGHGVIHRDLKPQNILMTLKPNGEYVPKITDFGISKQLDVNRSSVFSNSMAGAGTLAYASPEQLAERTIRKNADLWSFGVIAFQTITGTLPFTTGKHAKTSESGRLELFRQINSGQPPEAINSIDEPWQELIRTCLVTDPEKRVKNCEACNAILTGKPISAIPESVLPDQVTRLESVPPKPKPVPPKPKPVPPKPETQGGKPVSRHIKRILWGVAGAIVGLLLVFFLIRRSSMPSAEELEKFKEYKQLAIKNYEKAQDDDVEFYSAAEDYCNKALKIQYDSELERIKEEIKSRK